MGKNKRQGEKLSFLFMLGAFFASARLKFLEGFYSVHVKMRYTHDIAYKNIKTYKKYSDWAPSRAIHKATLASFVVSFIIFNLVQSLFPYLFNPVKPRDVQAGAAFFTWTSREDFGNGVTNPNLDISGTSLTSADGKILLKNNGIGEGFFGTGNDGDVTVSSANTKLDASRLMARAACSQGGDAVNYSVTALPSASSATLSIAPGANCLNIDDEVILINLQGTGTNFSNVGNYEFFRVASVSGTTVTFNAAKTKFYGDNGGDTNIGTAVTNQRVMLQRVPNYNSVTVNWGASLTVNSWNGAKGGVLVFRSKTTVNLGQDLGNASTPDRVASINVNGIGYRGGAGSTTGRSKSGEWYGGPSVDSGGTASASPAGLASSGGAGGGGAYNSGGNGGGTYYFVPSGSPTAGSIGSAGGGGGAATLVGGTGTGATGGSAGYGSVGNGGGSSPYNGASGSGAVGGTGGYSYSGFGCGCGCSNQVTPGGGGGGGTYGDSTTLDRAMFLGSGGGANGASNSVAGAAGGAGGGIILIAAKNINLNQTAYNDLGKIEANGITSGGSGSGGSIVIFSDNLNNSSSSLIANGGTNGGGGRTFAHIGAASGSLPAPNNFVSYASNYSTTATIGNVNQPSGLYKSFGSKVSPVSLVAELDGDFKTSQVDPLLPGQSVKFLVKLSTDGESWTTYDRNGAVVEDVESAFENSYFGQAFGDAAPYTDLSGLTTSPISFADIVVRVVSNGANTPAINQVSFGYNTLKAPVSLKQYNTNNIELASSNNYTNDTAVSLVADIQPLADATTFPSSLVPEVEVVAVPIDAADPDSPPTGWSFTGNPTTGNVSINSLGFTSQDCGGPNELGDCKYVLTGKEIATLTNLSGGNYYFWRMRYSDFAGRVSPWSSTYGTFRTDITAPTLAVTESSVSGNSTGGTTYLNAQADSKVVKYTFSAADDVSKSLQVQFSENKIDWGTLDGASNNTTNGGTWAAGTFKTVTGVTDILANFTVMNAWKFEADGEKTLYVRVRDAAGNIYGDNNLAKANWNASDGNYESGKVANGNSIKLNYDHTNPAYPLLTDSNGGYWTKKVPLTITNFQPNYQIKITVNYDSDMQADFDDIRFYDETTGIDLPYYIQSKADGVSAVVWFKTGANQNISMYYGNERARSLSSSSSVFEPGILNPSFETNSGWSNYTQNTGPINIIFPDSNWKTEGSGSLRFGMTIYCQMSGFTCVAQYAQSGGYTQTVNLPAGSNYKIIFDAKTDNFNGSASIKVGGSTVWSTTASNSVLLNQTTNVFGSGSQKIDIEIFSGAAPGTNANFDNFRIVKYTSPEPGVGFSQEQSQKYHNSATYISNVINTKIASPVFSRVTFDKTENNGATAILKVVGCATAACAEAGEEVNWITVNSGDVPNVLNDKQYFRYKVALSASADGYSTPIFDNLFIDWSVNPLSDTIIADYTAPADVSNLAGKESISGAAISSNTWYRFASQGVSPYFSWDTGSDPLSNGNASGLSGYNVYWGTTDADPATGGVFQVETIFANNLASLVSGANYYLNIKAKDNAGNFSANKIQFVFKYDSAAPTGLTTVYDGVVAATDAGYTTNKTQLSANWTAASDVSSGVQKYQYAIGTTAGGTQVVDWTDNGTSTSVTKTGLSLVDGTAYYFSIKAFDNVGNVTTAVNSNGQLVDSLAPSAPTNVYDGPTTDIQFAPSKTQLVANWTAAADVGGSGVQKYQYAIGTFSGGTDTLGWTDNGTNTSVVKTGLTLADGVTYYFSVRVVDNAGNTGTVANSNGQLVDTLAPTGTVTINNVATTPQATNNKAVKAYPKPTSPEPGGSGILEFQLSNDGANWGSAYNSATSTYTATWQIWNDAYLTDGFDWNLIKGQSDGGNDGNRDVFVRFKDRVGNITSTSSVFEKTMTKNSLTGGGTWTKRISLSITNPQANFQNKIVLNYDSDMQADFDDIRFYDETAGVELPYWIEYKTDSSSATIWFKSGSNANNTITIYYGNNNVSSASNGGNVFEFFDSFDGDSLDTSKWNANVPNGFEYSVANSKIYLRGSSITTKNYQISNGIMEYRALAEPNIVTNGCGTNVSFAEISSYARANTTPITTNHVGFGDFGSCGWEHTISVNNSLKANTVSSVPANTWLNLRSVLNGTALTKTRYSDNWASLLSTVSYNDTASGLTTGYIGLATGAEVNRRAYYDWVRVRKYVATEPTVALLNSSAINTGLILDTGAPAAVTNLAAPVASKNPVNLTWGKASDTGLGTKEYNVYRKKQSDAWSGTPSDNKIGTVTEANCTGEGATGCEYSDSSITEDGNYNYKIQAVDNINNEQTIGNTVITMLADNTAPLAPTSTLSGFYGLGTRQWIGYLPVTTQVDAGSAIADVKLRLKIQGSSTYYSGNPSNKWDGSDNSWLNSSFDTGSGTWRYSPITIQDFMLNEDSTYELSAKVTDAAGNTSENQVVTFSIDSSNPSRGWMDINQNNNNNFTRYNTATLNFYSLDGDIRTAPEFTGTEGGVRVFSANVGATAEAVRAGLDAAVWQTYDPSAGAKITGYVLPDTNNDGEKQVWVEFRDKAGNITTHHQDQEGNIITGPLTDTIVLDKTAAQSAINQIDPKIKNLPEISGTIFESGSGITNKNQVKIALVKDGSYWDGVMFQPGFDVLNLSNSLFWQEASTLSGSKPAYYFTYNSLPDFIDDDYTVYVKTQDNIGNTVLMPAETNFRFDGTAPILSVPTSSTHPNPNAWYTQTVASFAWSATDTATGDTDIVGYSFILDQNEGTTPDDALEVDQSTTTRNYLSLADGTYWFHVKAKDGAGNISETKRFKVNIDTTAPVEGNPVFGASGASESSIKLVWGAFGDDNKSEVKEYRIWRSTEKNNPASTLKDDPNIAPSSYDVSVTDPIIADGRTSYELMDEGLAKGWFYYKVLAYDNAGNVSNAENAYSKTNYAPEIANFTVNGGTTTITTDPTEQKQLSVSYSTTDADGRGDITKTEIYVLNRTGGQVVRLDQADPRMQRSEIANGYSVSATFNLPNNLSLGNYTIFAQVEDVIVARSPKTKSSPVTIQVKSGQVQNLVATGYTSTEIHLVWNAPAFTEGLRAENTYQVWMKEGNGEYVDRGLRATAPTAQNPYIISGLTMGATYTFKVVAYDVDNNAGAEATAVGIPPKPDAPTSAVLKEASHTSLDLGGTYPVRYVISWDKVTTDQVPDIKGYKVYRSTNNVWEQNAIKVVTDPNETYFVDAKTKNEATNTYQYRILTVDNSDNVGDSVETLASGQALTPEITEQPAVVEVGVSWVKINWKSNQPTSGIVMYKKKSESEYRNVGGDIKPSSQQAGSAFQNSVTIKGLEKGTEYDFRVRSMNASDALSAKSETISTSTKPFNIEFSTKTGLKIGSSSVVITWNTGEVESEGYVEYKMGNAEPKVLGTGKRATNHEVELKDLATGDYVFSLKNIDADGNIATSALQSFTITGFDTGTISAPQAGKIEERDITATSAKITWNSTVATTSWIDYGTTSGKYEMKTGNDTQTVAHVITLEGLTPGTTYYYVVYGTDANGTEYRSKEFTFVALAKPSISKVEVSNVGPYGAKVRVEVSKDVQASVTYGKDGNFDLKAGSSNMTKNHEIELKNLEDNGNYKFYVDVVDSAGNTARSEQGSFSTPMDKEGPNIDEVKIDILPLGESDEYAQAIISWQTNKPASTKIEYDEGVIGGKYSKSSIEDTSLNNSHTVIIKELNPSTTYHFRLVSKDKRGNLSASKDYTFVTPAKEKSILQLIIRSLEETFSWVKNVGGFFRGIGNKSK